MRNHKILYYILIFSSLQNTLLKKSKKKKPRVFSMSVLGSSATNYCSPIFGF